MKKRIFDFVFSLLLLIFFSWLIILLWVISTLVFKKNGFFTQKRIGQGKKEFVIIKIRSLKDGDALKINKFGNFIRKNKLDELPQLINVIKGEMSLVGPRPEIKSHFINNINYPKGLFSLKPGITGLASLYFINEAELEKAHNKNEFFFEWMYSKKNKLNLIYLNRMNLCLDLKIIYYTIFRLYFNK